jgi:hypothetical protein
VVRLIVSLKLRPRRCASTSGIVAKQRLMGGHDFCCFRERALLCGTLLRAPFRARRRKSQNHKGSSGFTQSQP